MIEEKVEDSAEMMEVASQTINRSKEKLCTPNVDERNESIEIMDVQIEENDLI